MRTLPWSFSLVTAMVLGGSCTDRVAFRCSADDDCELLQACVNGTCQRGCRSNADCRAGRTCEEHACGYWTHPVPVDTDEPRGPPPVATDAGPDDPGDPGHVRPEPQQAVPAVVDTDGPATDAGPPSPEIPTPTDVGRDDAAVPPLEPAAPDPEGVLNGRTDAGPPADASAGPEVVVLDNGR